MSSSHDSFKGDQSDKSTKKMGEIDKVEMDGRHQGQGYHTKTGVLNAPPINKVVKKVNVGPKNKPKHILVDKELC